MKRCYCFALLRPDGNCPFKCPPHAAPKHLRRQEVAGRKVDRESIARKTNGYLNRKDAREGLARVEAKYGK